MIVNDSASLRQAVKIALTIFTPAEQKPVLLTFLCKCSKEFYINITDICEIDTAGSQRGVSR